MKERLVRNVCSVDINTSLKPSDSWTPFKRTTQEESIWRRGEEEKTTDFPTLAETRIRFQEKKKAQKDVVHDLVRALEFRAIPLEKVVR
jgi:hypothetical protein